MAQNPTGSHPQENGLCSKYPSAKPDAETHGMKNSRFDNCVFFVALAVVAVFVLVVVIYSPRVDSNHSVGEPYWINWNWDPNQFERYWRHY